MASTTKRALAKALTELLNVTPLDSITVKDIVQRAKVSRQTFYYHFDSLYELLDWTFQSMIQQLCDLPADSWRDRLLWAVAYLRENRVLAMNVYHSLGVEYLARGLRSAVRPLVAEEMQTIAKQLSISRDDEEFATSFFTYGIIGTLTEWLDEGMPDNLDRVINDIHRLLNPTEKHFLSGTQVQQLPERGDAESDPAGKGRNRTE